MNNEIVIGITNTNLNTSPFESINAIKKAGFKNVFIQWYNKNWNPSQEEQLKYIKKIGLNVVAAHLEYENINDIWIDHKCGEELVKRYKRDIKIMSDNKIHLVFMHLTTGIASVKYNEIGLKRLKKIIKYAEKLNVKISFENTELRGYLEYVFKNIYSDIIGLCFDSGHFHAFYKDNFDFNKFKNKITSLHLHDNDKNKDLHLLPFDGTLDWNNLLIKLKESNYKGLIILEPKYTKYYSSISIYEFYKKAYEKAIKLYNMM